MKNVVFILFEHINKMYNTIVDSIASWLCIGTSGKFGYGTKEEYIETVEPDRSKCIHKWIADVEEEVRKMLCVANAIDIS